MYTLLSRCILLPLLALALASCSSAGIATEDGVRRDPNRLTLQEMSNGSYATALDAVAALRPAWLRVRPATTFQQTDDRGDLVVYLDNVQFGSYQALESISAADVDFIELIDSSSATQRWGTGHTGGAIVVTTRRSP